MAGKNLIKLICNRHTEERWLLSLLT